ncbi:MAG: hypothetical protein B7Z80_15455 [Rhodospirillales bacterium 20-64-7]|nr:MAG: hypothetical protein B7Z80_15455 [Rhodospirillales bacterium 20-64-7]
MHQELRAAAARYDAAGGRVVVELVNGCAYAFPSWMVPALAGAPPAVLAEVMVGGVGFELEWPRLACSLHVPGLLTGLFGTKEQIMREAAREAGRVRSPAKAAAARRNGAKGGRPRKVG